LLPEDYLALLNPIWCGRELRGRIEAIHPETADAATLVIRPGPPWVGHVPGQWVRIGIDIEGVRHWRTYSLSSPPGVSRSPSRRPGRFVSRYLVRQAAPGTIVELAGPDGEFVLPEPPPSRLLFLTASSGITPVRAMLYGLLADAAGGSPSTTGIMPIPTRSIATPTSRVT
jgi:ferredoxin-NADP reductase